MKKKNYHQAGNPINPLRIEALRVRLTELVTPHMVRHRTSQASDRVQRVETNLPQPDEEGYVEPVVVESEQP